MRVFLNICGAGFIAKDAATAAKVVDLLGTMKPVSTGWLNEGRLLVEGHQFASDLIEVTQIGDVVPMKRKTYEQKKHEESENEKKCAAKNQIGGVQ